jgi:uncharacterized membrane protein
VYSITNRASFLHIGDWLRDIQQHAEENVSIIMVGNMRDLCEGEEDEESPEATVGNHIRQKREVTTKEAEEYAKKEG